MTTHTVPPELWDDILGKELADELREWDKMPKSQWVTTFAPADKFKIVIGKGGTGQVTFHSAPAHLTEGVELLMWVVHRLLNERDAKLKEQSNG